jgi:exopolysaccharide production protein ExoQ
MTGRAGIFEALYPVLWKRPIFGFGYQAFWLGMRGESANVFLNTGTANAENGILQMWLELGAIGTGVMVLLLLRSFWSGMICLAHTPSKFVRWNCSIIFLSLLSAINGDKFMYPDTIEWVLFVLAYINLTEEVRRTRVDAVEVGSLAWAS